jgi:hypothetical protein
MFNFRMIKLAVMVGVVLVVRSKVAKLNELDKRVTELEKKGSEPGSTRVKF